MTHRMKILSTLIVFAAGMTAGASKADDMACEDFRVFHEYLDVQLIDHGPPGLSVGDARVGQVRSLDENGREIGRQHFQSMVISDAVDGRRKMVGNGHEVFDNGTISWSGSYEMADPSVVGPPAKEVVVSVIGGSGAFKGAQGTLTWFNDDNGKRVGAFDIVCVR